MKKAVLFFVFVAALAMFQIVPAEKAMAQGNCNGCWWNDVDRDCCENGSMCCGMCGGGAQLV